MENWTLRKYHSYRGDLEVAEFLEKTKEDVKNEWEEKCGHLPDELVKVYKSLIGIFGEEIFDEGVYEDMDGSLDKDWICG